MIKLIRHEKNQDIYQVGTPISARVNGDIHLVTPYASLTTNTETLYLRHLSDFSGFSGVCFGDLCEHQETQLKPEGIVPEDYEVIKVKHDGKWIQIPLSEVNL